MAAQSRQIDLLFGVKGGGSVNGESGKNIQSQINGIISGLKVNIQVDYTAVTNAVSALKKIEDQINTINRKSVKINMGTGGNNGGNNGSSGSTWKQAYNNVKKYIDICKDLETGKYGSSSSKEWSEVNGQLQNVQSTAEKLRKIFSNLNFDKDGNPLIYGPGQTTNDEMLQFNQSMQSIGIVAKSSASATKILGDNTKEYASAISLAQKNITHFIKYQDKLKLGDFGDKGSQTFKQASSQMKNFVSMAPQIEKIINNFNRNGALSDNDFIFIEKFNKRFKGLETTIGRTESAAKVVKNINKEISKEISKDINNTTKETSKIEAKVKKAQKIIDGFSSKEMKFFNLDKTLGQTKLLGTAINEMKDLAATFTKHGKIKPVEKMSDSQIRNLEKYISLNEQLPRKINSAVTATKKHKAAYDEVAKAQKNLNALSSKEDLVRGMDRSLPQVKAYRNALAEIKVISKSFTSVGERNQILPIGDLSKSQLNAIKNFNVLYEKLPLKINQATIATKKLKAHTSSLSSGQIMLNKLYESYNKFKNIKDYPDLVAKYNDILNSILSKRGSDNKIKLTAEEVKKLKTDINAFENACYEANVQVDTFGEAIEHKIGDRIKYLIGQFAIDFVVQGLRRVYDNVLQIDSAMTELKKVTDETGEAYDRFLTNAGKRAKELGASLVEVVNMTADYARLGYDVDEASNLADAAIIYRNVGDGLKNADEATDHLISTMKAFGIEASNSMRIVDAFNEVSNNFAVTSSDIGAGLQRSSAAMAAAGNSMEETIALFTAGNTIIRDADTMGTSLKTISMRLRSTKSDLEAMGEDTDGAAESVSSLRKELLALTGVDIQLDENTYKNTYEILQELSKVWDNLDDLTQANVLEKLFGKRQANVGAAILENFNIAEESLETAMNSTGSAVAENEKHLESIRGHLDQLTASFQTLSTNVLDSELVKFGVDVLRLIVDLLNEIFVLSHALGDFLKEFNLGLGETINLIGTLTVIAGGASLIDGLFGFKHVKDVTNTLQQTRLVIQGLKGLYTSMSGMKAIQGFFGLELDDKELEKLFKVVEKIKSIPKILAAGHGIGVGASIFGGILLALPFIVAGVGAWQAKLHDVETTTKKINEQQEEYDSAVSDLDALNGELEENKKRIEELEKIEIPTAVEAEELNLLKEKNQLLADQIELKKQLVAAEKDDIYDSTVEAIDDTWGYRNGGIKSASVQYYSQQQGEIFKGDIDRIQGYIDAEIAKGAEANQELVDYYSEQQEEYEEKYLDWQEAIITAREKLIGATDAEHVASREAMDEIINWMNYQNSDSPMAALIADSRFTEIIDFMKQFKSVSITDTQFGNIDLNNRQVLEWTEQTLAKYKEAIESWGLNPAELEGTISTVLGSSSEFEGVEIAFSPMLQTPGGEAVLLDQNTVGQYIFGLIEKAGENWTKEDILRLDSEGIIVNGREIKNIIADVGDTAIETGAAMHYLGTQGEISPDDIKYFIDTLEGLGYTVEQVEDSVDSLYETAEGEVDFSIDTASLEAAREAVKALSSECKNMADAFKEQNENGSLSVDTILDVIDAGYAAALVIDQETGAVKLDAAAYKELADAKIALQISDLQLKKGELEQTLLLEQEKLAALDTAKGYAVLAEAKKLSANIDLVTAQIAALEAQIVALNSINVDKITQGIYGIGDAAADAKSKLSKLQSGMENLLSQTISWLKQEYNDAQEAQENYYESQIDALEDAKDAAKDRWDAEKEAIEDAKDSYNDLIDAQIELLKRQKEADDYAKSRAEKEDAVADIENQLLAIENDDSIEAQKMRLELQEQLKEAKDELEELQSDREYELREQALQDEKDRYNDEIDAKLDAIEKQSEAEEKAYQDRIDRLRKYLDAVRAAEKTEAQWRAEA